jgi:RNA polymerase sigma factor (sigma-70 family)
MNSTEFLHQLLPLRDALFRFAFRLVGSRAEAEDVVQDVYLKLWDKRDELDDIKNPQAYSMTMTRHLSLDKKKNKHAQTSELPDTYELPNNVSHSLAEEIEQKDLLQRVHIYMCQLPEKQRAVMHLRDVEGLSYEEIVVALEMTMQQVKTNLFRARQAIRERVRE